jgi:hypothetical protein
MLKILATSALLFVCSSALAQTTTYQYDALGRLVGSATSTNGSQVNTSIAYDPAGNRSRYLVSGAVAPNGANTGGASAGPNTGSGVGPTPSSSPMFVVVPLNGFTIIPLN